MNTVWTKTPSTLLIQVSIWNVLEGCIPLPLYLDFSTVAWKYFGLGSSWFPGDCSGYFRILSSSPAFYPPVTSIMLVTKKKKKNLQIFPNIPQGKREREKKKYTPGLQSQELSFVRIPELLCSLGALVLEMPRTLVQIFCNAFSPVLEGLPGCLCHWLQVIVYFLSLSHVFKFLFFFSFHLSFEC